MYEFFFSFSGSTDLHGMREWELGMDEEKKAVMNQIDAQGNSIWLAILERKKNLFLLGNIQFSWGKKATCYMQ